MPGAMAADAPAVAVSTDPAASDSRITSEVKSEIARPGVYEAAFGATLRELIDLAGGVSGSGRVQAVLLGGAQ